MLVPCTRHASPLVVKEIYIYPLQLSIAPGSTTDAHHDRSAATQPHINQITRLQTVMTAFSQGQHHFLAISAIYYDLL